MLRYDAFISESLADEVKIEPKSNAAKEARRLGLTYMGFGRYADSKGKVAYIVDQDRLIPYKGRDEVQSMYSKDSASSIAYASVLNNRDKEDSKIIKQKSKDTQALNRALYKFYKPDIFDDAEINAIQYYTAEGFGPVNRYLYKGHDKEVSPELDATINSTIEALDSAFENTQSPFAYTVYSGLSSRYSSNKLEPGEDYIFRGYVSSSIDFTTAIDAFTESDWSDSVVALQIEVAKGQKSIYVDPISSNAGEGETLLPRGSKIRIVSGPHMIEDQIVSQNSSGSTVRLFHCQLVEE
jgi:hypothetical protein